MLKIPCVTLACRAPMLSPAQFYFDIALSIPWTPFTTTRILLTTILLADWHGKWHIRLYQILVGEYVVQSSICLMFIILKESIHNQATTGIQAQSYVYFTHFNYYFFINLFNCIVTLDVFSPAQFVLRLSTSKLSKNLVLSRLSTKRCWIL